MLAGYYARMDEFEYLAQSGDWRANPWWERPDRQVHSTYPKEEIARYADVLHRHFDTTWAKDIVVHDRQNIVFPYLCIGGSTMALRFIVYLGKMLQLLESAEGLGRIVADLKGDKGDSALLELEAAYSFAKAGYQVRFPSEQAIKSPDVLVTSSTMNFAIECKRLRSEAWERWENNLTNRIIRDLPKMKGDQQISVQVMLNPRLTQVCMSQEKEPALNNAFLDTVAEQILSSIIDAVAHIDVPFELDIPELALVTVARRENGEYGSVQGMERASPPITRRIFQNGIFRACEQLPNEIPGIIFVYSQALPAARFFKLFFDTACRSQPERFSGIVAVVLCPMQTIFRTTAPNILINRDTRFQTSIDKCLAVLSSKFGGELISDDSN